MSKNFPDENPFGEPTQNDPFADPAVQRAASAVTKKEIDEYNPFADQPGSGSMGQPVRGAANPPVYGGTTTITNAQQPAMLQTSSQEAPPPNYTRNAQQTMPPQVNSGMFSPPAGMVNQQPGNEGWRRNEPDINSTPYYPRRNNWPPLPESCCVQPCFYQDIDVEIQTDFQRIVRQLYHLWIFHVIVMLANSVSGFILMFTEGKDYFNIFGVGLVYLVLFTPFSFICWFRPAYQAFKNDSSFNFMVFFFMFFFQAVITVFQSIGFSIGSGTLGLFVALTQSHLGSFTEVLGTILKFSVATGYCLAAAGDIILISKVHRIYRNTGASVVKAQEEFTSNFLSNQHVQSAAGNVAASAVRAQVNSMTQQPRY